MTNELNASIQKAITENLTGVVADELKLFIANAQDTAKRLERTLAEQVTTQRQLNEANEKLATHREVDKKLEEILAKEKDLQSREITLRQDTAMNRALVAEASLKTGLEVMGLIFRNTEVSKRVLGTIPVAVDGSPASQYNQGSPGYAHQAPIDKTETETKS